MNNNKLINKFRNSIKYNKLNLINNLLNRWRGGDPGWMWWFFK